MKSVQNNFHPLNVHFTTHGQDPPKKNGKKSNSHGHNQVQFMVYDYKHLGVAQNHG
jgi:hypothetical protein